MTKLKNLLSFILISIFSSCSNSTKIPEYSIPKNVDEFARAYIENIYMGNIDTCLSVSSVLTEREKWEEFLKNTYKNIRNSKLKSIKIVGYTSNTILGNNGFTNYFIDYEYNYGKYIYFGMNIQEKGRELTIFGLNEQSLEKPISENSTFSFSKLRYIHYIFLFFMIIIPILTVLTIIYMVQTPMKRKWLWIIGSLVGVMSFNLNWSTGDFQFQVLTFQLLGIGLFKAGPLAPWILSFSMPPFSVIFWLKRKSFIVNDELEKYLANEREEREDLINS